MTAQRSGYASTLFRHYERLFRDLGFHQFRLNASLSVGKYYWAQEGFDFSDRSEVGRRKAALRALVKERSLPVREVEIGRLNHAYDFARFRRDLRIPVYRDAEGFYSLTAGDRFREEVSLPLGKAFLLSSAPWDGYKTIYTNTPRRTGFVTSQRVPRSPDAGRPPREPRAAPHAPEGGREAGPEEQPRLPLAVRPRPRVPRRDPPGGVSGEIPRERPEGREGLLHEGLLDLSGELRRRAPRGGRRDGGRGRGPEREGRQRLLRRPASRASRGTGVRDGLLLHQQRRGRERSTRGRSTAWRGSSSWTGTSITATERRRSSRATP